MPWILHAQIQRASWQEPSPPQGRLHPLRWEGVPGDRLTVPTHPLLALVYQRCHVQNELVWVRVKPTTAVAQHRRQNTQFSQFLSFLPVIPSPAFPLEVALLALHSQQPRLLVSSLEPGPKDSCRVPLTLPATGHHHTVIAAPCPQELGE